MVRIGNGANNGGSADYVVVAQAGKTSQTDMATGTQTFSEIMGCYQTTNQGYAHNCVGGDINLTFCTTNYPRVADEVPIYQLGPPTVVEWENLSYSPPGQLGAGNGDNSASTRPNTVTTAITTTSNNRNSRAS
ncbi:MAG: hypothetical protein Q9201_005499 [Fulgogasparrea decipioides]